MASSDNAPGELLLRADSRLPSSAHVATHARYLADERECVLAVLPLARAAVEGAAAFYDEAARTIAGQ